MIAARPGAFAEDEAADHDVVPGLHEAARADIRQLRIRRLIKVVHFDEADANRLVFPSTMAV